MVERFNRAVCGSERSGIREFAQMAKETPGCISLTLGEPDFDTPPVVRNAAKLALDAGETHYIENNGTFALREAIAEFERARNGMDYAPDEVIVTVGASEALFAALFAILNPGDEVIIPTPAFGLYASIVGLCRGVSVPVPTENAGFQLTRGMLKKAVTDKTKAIILNSPNNPTGCVYTIETLRAVRDAVAGRGIFVICDDVYRQLAFADDCHSFAEFRELREQIIVVQSFSKAYAMTGWRAGYMMADRPVVREIGKVHQCCVTSAASTVQRACMAALKCDPAEMRGVYRRRRDFAVKRLDEMGLPVHRPEGAFYLFPSIAEFQLDSDQFCRRMICEAGLAAVPGSCFGTEGYIRISFCCPDAHLAEGLTRLEKFIQMLRRNG